MIVHPIVHPEGKNPPPQKLLPGTLSIYLVAKSLCEKIGVSCLKERSLLWRIDRWESKCGQVKGDGPAPVSWSSAITLTYYLQQSLQVKGCKHVSRKQATLGELSIF